MEYYGSNHLSNIPSIVPLYWMLPTHLRAAEVTSTAIRDAACAIPLSTNFYFTVKVSVPLFKIAQFLEATGINRGWCQLNRQQELYDYDKFRRPVNHYHYLRLEEDGEVDDWGSWTFTIKVHKYSPLGREGDEPSCCLGKAFMWSRKHCLWLIVVVPFHRNLIRVKSR